MLSEKAAGNPDAAKAPLINPNITALPICKIIKLVIKRSVPLPAMDHAIEALSWGGARDSHV